MKIIFSSVPVLLSFQIYYVRVNMNNKENVRKIPRRDLPL